MRLHFKMDYRLLVILFVLNSYFARCFSLERENCGRTNPNKWTINGTEITVGDSPWHAAIYKLSPNSSFTLICGSTIVSPIMIISAAYCFNEEIAKPEVDLNLYRIFVGKISSDYYKNDSKFQRVYEVKEILFPSDYMFQVGLMNQSNDITVLVPQEPITFNSRVLPACIDWNGLFPFNPPRYIAGQIAVWGTHARRPLTGNEILHPADLQYIRQHECQKKIMPVVADRFCANSDYGDVPCQGDLGSGLLFKTQENELYYLRGILNAPVRCIYSSIFTFTNLTYHTEWLRAVNRRLNMLLQAAEKGDLDLVRDLIPNTTAGIKLINNQGDTALHIAAGNGRLNVVQFLVKIGADVNVKNIFRATPLLRAAEKGHVNVVEYLTENQADFNLQDNQGDTALHLATFYGHLNVTQRLIVIQNGTGLNTPGSNKETPLLKAAKNGHLDIIKYLATEENAEIELKSNEGLTAVLYAAQNGHWDIVGYLLKEENADPNTRADDGRIILHYAAKANKSDLVHFLVSEKKTDFNVESNDGTTPLIEAASYGHLNIVKYFTEQLANINLEDNRGDTAVHLAAKYGHTKVIEYLIENGADVTTKGSAGEIPLLKAARHGHLNAVQYLIKNETDLAGLKDKWGDTALHLAASNGHVNVIEYLTGEKYANLNTTGLWQETPLLKSAKRGQLAVVEYLVKNKVDINSKNYQNYTALHLAAKHGHVDVVKYLIKSGAALNFRGLGETTPLHLAATQGHVDIVKYLVEEKADISLRDWCNNSAVHLASGMGHMNLVEYLISVENVMLVAGSYNETPLHKAAKYGHWSVVKYLVEERNANVDIKDRFGNIPAVAATKASKENISMYLKRIGIIHLAKKFNHEAAAALGLLDLVKYFIENEGEINFPSLSLGSVFYDLNIATCAGHLNVVEYLLETYPVLFTNYSYFVERNETHCIPAQERAPLLYFAICRDYTDLFEYLFERGDDVNAPGAFIRETPLQVAAECGSLNAVKYFTKKGQDMNERSFLNRSAVELAISNGHIEIVEYFVEHGADVTGKNIIGSTLLHIAAARGRFNIVKYLIEDLELEINAKNNNNETALDLALDECYLDIIKYFIEEKGMDIHVVKPRHLICAVVQDTPDLLNYMVSHKAHINSKDDITDYIPLLKAVTLGKMNFVEYLVKLGVDVNAETNRGETSLHMAVRLVNLNLIKYLIENKVDVNGMDNTNRTALYYAIPDTGLVAYLVQNGAVVNTKDVDECTPLCYAAEKAALDTIKYLVELNADINSTDNLGETTLHKAVRVTKYESCTIECPLEVQTENCKPCLILHLYIVKYLVEHGVDINARNRDGKTALNVAEDCHMTDIIQYLQSQTT